MINKELRERIGEINKQAIVFEAPAFDKSIIGITTYGAVVYSKENMINELASECGCKKAEALEFINNQTVMSLQNCNSAFRPIIVEKV